MSTQINNLGSNLIVKLLRVENYQFTNLTNPLRPPIFGMKYVRGLANIVCELECNFVTNCYVLNDDGKLDYLPRMICGDPRVWTSVISEDIDYPSIKLIKDNLTDYPETIEILFEFVREVPPQYNVSLPTLNT